MKKNSVFLLLRLPAFAFLLLLNNKTEAQYSLNIEYGRAWYFFKLHDPSNGLSKDPYNYYPFAGITLHKTRPTAWDYDFGLYFTPYYHQFNTSQYSSTTPENYASLQAGFAFCYAPKKSPRKLKAMPYAGINMGYIFRNDFEYSRVFWDITTGSLTPIIKGTVNYTRIMAGLKTGVKLQYQLSKRTSITVNTEYLKGLFRIYKYDFLYNNGSGTNDTKGQITAAGNLLNLRGGILIKLDN